MIMDIRYAISEGFSVTVFRDIGGPLSSDKLASACKWCGNGIVFVSTLWKPEFGDFMMPVHDFCFEEATRFVNDHQRIT